MIPLYRTAALESFGTIFVEFRLPKDIYLLLKLHRNQALQSEKRLLRIQAIYSIKFAKEIT